MVEAVGAGPASDTLEAEESAVAVRAAEHCVANGTGVAETIAADGPWPVVDMGTAVSQLVVHGVMKLAVADWIVRVVWIYLSFNARLAVDVTLQGEVAMIDGGPSEGIVVAIH